MPTYLCHGFRWHRDAISFFVIVQDIDDAAPGWVVAPQSSEALLTQFYELFDFLPYRNGRQGREQESADDHAPQVPGAGPSSSGTDRGQQDDPATSGDGGTSPIIGGPSKRGKSPSREPEDDDDDDETPTLSPITPQLPRGPPAAATAASEGEEGGVPAPPTSDWSAVTLLEEFDPANLSIVSGPWAYVADHVVRVDTSVSVAEEMLRYGELERSRTHKAIRSSSNTTGKQQEDVASGAAAGWFEKLRDKLQSSELIRWYVVVCGDEERDAYGRSQSQEEEEEEEEEEAQGEEENKSPKLEEGYEDKAIGATSEGGHHEHQQPLKQQQPQQHQPPPFSEGVVPEKGTSKSGVGGIIGKGGNDDDDDDDDDDDNNDDGGFKPRLPEFLESSKEAHEQRPRTAKKADWNAVLEKPPPFLKQDPPPIMTSSSRVGTAATAADDGAHDHKTAITSAADAGGGGGGIQQRQRQKKASRTSGLRKFFAKRLGVGRKRNSEPTQVIT